jgi:hypothetical protein
VRAENDNEPGAVGTSGVKEYVWLFAGFVAIVFVAVIELTVGAPPELLSERKFPEPVPEAVMPMDAPGDTGVPVSRLVR